jgi:uncharacterized membrane protein
MASTLLTTAAKSLARPDSRIAKAVEHLPPMRTNVSASERWLSAIAGGALLTFGFNGRGPSVCSALTGAYLLTRAATGNCMGYQLLGISTSDSTADNTSVAARHGTRVEHEFTIRRPVSQVYRFWRNLENLPSFMKHLESVREEGERSHWVARGPLGMRCEWDAVIISDEPNRVISWQSLDEADVDTAGSVHFRGMQSGRETLVRIQLKYDPPGGQLGTAIARLLGEDPQQQIVEDMNRLKQMMESGSVREPAAV